MVRQSSSLIKISYVRPLRQDSSYVAIAKTIKSHFYQGLLSPQLSRMMPSIPALRGRADQAVWVKDG